MAGLHGPIPKRSDERIRRNAADPIDKVTTIGKVKIPPLGINNPHPFITELYESMKVSGQSKFYEPSDWAHAKFTFHFANKLLRSTKPSAQMLASVSQMMTSLMLTEGDRRRLRIEVDRTDSVGTETEVPNVVAMFKDQLSRQQKQA